MGKWDLELAPEEAGLLVSEHVVAVELEGLVMFVVDSTLATPARALQLVVLQQVVVVVVLVKLTAVEVADSQREAGVIEAVLKILQAVEAELKEEAVDVRLLLEQLTLGEARYLENETKILVA